MFQTGDLTQLETAKDWLGLSGLSIASITNANPAVVTLKVAPTLPLLTGRPYTIQGATGIAGVNAEWIITTIDEKSFSIPTDTTANGTYTGGGYLAASDPLVSRLISACSQFAQTTMSRIVANATYTEPRDGQGVTAMTMRNQPITSVASVTVDGISIPARPALTAQGSLTGPTFGYGCGPFGFVNDDTRIMLSGGAYFSRGYQNVVVVYDAGFLATETQTVPAAPGPYTLTTLSHWSAGDRGVVYAATGVALVAVASSPAQGQYSVDGSVYTFNALDTGLAVILSYSFVPADLEQAVVDMMGDWFRYQARIGQQSAALEGQSVTFVNVPIPPRAQEVINKYNTVTPV